MNWYSRSRYANLFKCAVSNLHKDFSGVKGVSYNKDELLQESNKHSVKYLAVLQSVHFFVYVHGQVESRGCHQDQLDILEASQQRHQRVYGASRSMNNSSKT